MLLRRLLQLYAGLALYGASAGLIILSQLGNDPWDVLHQGLSRQTGIGTGIWVCIAGALVMLLWIPLRQRPGFGTLVEAMSGFAARTGFPDREPVLPPLALADMIAGINTPLRRSMA